MYVLFQGEIRRPPLLKPEDVLKTLYYNDSWVEIISDKKHKE
ncbi:MAG: hypothetical protein ACK5LK_05060 [Chthoniobacterales bacterium]